MADIRAGQIPSSWGASNASLPEGDCPEGPKVLVNFIEEAWTVWGENVYLSGSLPQLGSWDPFSALLLSSDDYPEWNVTTAIATNQGFEYKFLKIKDEQVTWEAGDNRVFRAPVEGEATVQTTWQ